MTIAGNHGGSTSRESYVALLTWLVGNVKSAPAREVQHVEQVDLVPTLSTLLGLQIPHKSTGVTFDGRLHNNDAATSAHLAANAQQYYVLALSNHAIFEQKALGKKKYNKQVCLKKLRSADELNECAHSNSTSSERIAQCTSALKRAQHIFMTSNENLDYAYIGAGVALSAIVGSFFYYNY